MLQAGQHTARHDLIIARPPSAAAARSQPASPTAYATAGGHAGAHAAAGRAIRRRKRIPAHALHPRRPPARTSGGNSASGGRCRASAAAGVSVTRHCGGFPQRKHPDRTVQLSWHAHHAYQGVRRAGASGASVGSGAGLAELRAPWRRRVVARDSCPGLGRHGTTLVSGRAMAARARAASATPTGATAAGSRRGAVRAATKAPRWAAVGHSAATACDCCAGRQPR